MLHRETNTVGGTRLSPDVVGYDVEGRNERLGRIERVSHDGTWALVSTGRLRGKTFALPAREVRLVDPESEAILVDVSKEELHESPRYDSHQGFDDGYEESLRSYYGSLRAGRSR
jgi:hypothetical protein